jgi:serine/threonine-protein kinase RsbW
MDRLREALDRIGAERSIDPKALVQLHVALDEMASNVIKYAWPEGGVHDINVSFTVGAGEVKIEIVDGGRDFNPLHTPPPERPRPGQRPRPGGVGVHLVKQLMDKIEFARAAGRNHLTLIKRCAVGLPPQCAKGQQT